MLMVEYFNHPSILGIHHFLVQISRAISFWLGFLGFFWCISEHFSIIFFLGGYLEIPQRWGRSWGVFCGGFQLESLPGTVFCWVDDPSLAFWGQKFFEGYKKHIEIVEVHLSWDTPKPKTKIFSQKWWLEDKKSFWKGPFLGANC